MAHDLIKLFDFFNPDSGEATTAARVSEIINAGTDHVVLTGNSQGKTLRTALRAAGYTGKIFLYIKMNSLHDPNQITNTANPETTASFNNTVTFGRTGILRNLLDNHNDWFLHRQDNGNVVTENDGGIQYAYLNMNNVDCRAWYVQQVEDFLAVDDDWDGVWWDNLHATSFTAASGSAITTVEYGAGNSDTWRTAQKNWAKYFDTEVVSQYAGWHFLFNLQGEDPLYWYQFIDHILTLDSAVAGNKPYVFVEFFAISSVSDEKLMADLQRDLDKVRYAQSVGVPVECVAHFYTDQVGAGNAGEITERDFAIAAYLLITGTLTAFSGGKEYTYFVPYNTEYNAPDSLGAPDGTYYESPAGTLRRNYSNGYVTVTPPTSSGNPGSSVIGYTAMPLTGLVPPLINAITDKIHAVGSTIGLQVNATPDASGGVLAFSATGLPSGLSINTVTGLISGVIKPDASQENSVSVTVSVTLLGVTASASIGWNWTVQKGTLKYRINPGGSLVTAALNDPNQVAYEADTTASPNGRLTANGSTASANGVSAPLVYHSSVPSWAKIAQLFRDFRFDSANPGPLYTFTGLTSGRQYRVWLHWSSGGDLSNTRTMTPIIDGVTKTNVSSWTNGGSTTLTASSTYYDVTASSSSMTVQINSASGTGRIFGIEIFEHEMEPSFSAPASLNVVEGQSAQRTLSATDPNGGSVTYSLVNPPAWMSIAGNTITAAPPLGTNPAAYSRTVRAQKSNGLYSDQTFTTNVEDAPNTAPVLAAIGNKSVNENALLTISLSATDADGDTLTFTSTTRPTGATLTDHGNGTATFSWTPTYAQAGSYPITFTVSDGTLTDAEAITVTVNNVNRAPVWTPIPDKTVTVGNLLQFDVSATSPDGHALDLYVNVASGPLLEDPPFTLDDHGNGTGTFTWTPIADHEGTHELYFTAFDRTNNDFFSEEVMNITVEPADTPPDGGASHRKKVAWRNNAFVTTLAMRRRIRR
jgi:hypothetical protein